MRKNVLILVAALLMSGAASAQIVYHYGPANTAPWTGDNLFSLHVGTFYQPATNDPFATEQHPGIPLSLSLRYDGEQAIGTHWVVGFQTELNHSRSHSSYTLDGAEYSYYSKNPYASQWLNYDVKNNATTLEVRIMAGYYLMENLSLHAAAGLYGTFLQSGSTSFTITNKATGTQSEPKITETSPTFGINSGFSGTLGADYYFNDNLFVTATAKLHIPIRFFDEDKALTSSYGLMVGIGYKFIR